MKRLALLFLVLAATSARAHDFWIERTAEDLVLLYGHGRAHNEEARLSEYRPEIVARVDCFDGEGTRGEAAVSSESPIRISGGCAAACVLVSTGYWSRTPEGTRNVSKKDAAAAIKSWQSFISIKRIDEWGEGLSRPLTSDFEITPLVNPLVLGSGAKIDLLVTLGGEPVQGATVTCGKETSEVTGEDGRASVKIPQGGFQAIRAKLAVPVESEYADETIYVANLNFEIGAPQ